MSKIDRPNKKEQTRIKWRKAAKRCAVFLLQLVFKALLGPVLGDIWEFIVGIIKGGGSGPLDNYDRQGGNSAAKEALCFKPIPTV